MKFIISHWSCRYLKLGWAGISNSYFSKQSMGPRNNVANMWHVSLVLWGKGSWLFRKNPSDKTFTSWAICEQTSGQISDSQAQLFYWTSPKENNSGASRLPVKWETYRMNHQQLFLLFVNSPRRISIFSLACSVIPLASKYVIQKPAGFCSGVNSGNCWDLQWLLNQKVMIKFLACQKHKSPNVMMGVFYTEVMFVVLQKSLA